MTKLSRSKIDLFIECPRCFWLDVKQGIKRPPPAPYTINNAIDYLLKQEFDVHRDKGTRHAIMEKYNIDAVPLNVPEMSKWRHNFTGVQYQHQPTDFLVYGAVDDIWINPNKEFIVVDYKATGAKQHQIYDSYKRQMEIYQWLLSQNGYKVSPTGYFVFARANKTNGFGNGEAKLSFDIFVEPQIGDNSWMEDTLKRARETYDSDLPPKAGASCIYCEYRNSAQGLLN